MKFFMTPRGVTNFERTRLPMRFTMRRLAGLALLIMLAGCSGTGSGVIGSGTVEMDEIDVSSMVGGRVVRLAYDEGDTVSAGDTLAVLDRGELAADIDAQTAQAVAKLCDGVVVGSRIVQEIENSSEKNIMANVGKLVKELRRAIDNAA